MTYKEVLYIIFVILLSILLAVFVPFIAIWAMNTLVPVAQIAYNFWTWLSVVILGLFFRSTVSIKYDN